MTRTRTRNERKAKVKKKKRREPVEEPDDLDALLEGDTPPKLRKDGWPEVVPILVEGDMIWNWYTRDGRRDLKEWLEVTFDTTSNLTPRQDKAYRVLCAVITERFGRPVNCLWLFLEFTFKHRLPSLAWQAACWNEMMRRLGYEVPKRSTKDPGFKTAVRGK